MKKIITLLAVIGMFGFQGCTGPEGPPGMPGQDGADGLSAQAFEIKNKSLSRIADNHYELSGTFNNYLGGDLFDDENVLIYRMTGTINSTTPIWQLIPRTIYFDDGNELDYDYDFSKVDFVISATGTYNLLNKAEFINNQTFRIVIIPTNLLTSVNKNNYYEVISVLNIKENQIQKIDIQ